MGTEDAEQIVAAAPLLPSTSANASAPNVRLARLLPLLLLLVLLDNKVVNDLVRATIHMKVLSSGLSLPAAATLYSTPHTKASTPSASASASTASAINNIEGGPLPIHAYTCVYSKDWRLVLLERPSPLYLGGTIRHLSTSSVERLTLITNFAAAAADGGAEETQAEVAFRQLCELLMDEGHVVRCRTARVPELVAAALSYYNITVDSFGGPERFRKSACPLIATYLEATRGDDEDESGERPRSASAASFASPGAPLPQSLVVFWEGDVSIVRPGSWVATAAAFSGAHPSMNVSTCPCFRLMNRDECVSELDMGSAANLAIPSSLRPPRLLPDDWVPFRRPRFSQQLFALPSASLASIDWKQAGSMPDEACGPFPDEGGFEHRACKWLARWEWVSAMHLDAAYVHAGLNNDTLLELSEFLTGQGWPWDPQR
jgi:hypothetical protein